MLGAQESAGQTPSTGSLLLWWTVSDGGVLGRKQHAVSTAISCGHPPALLFTVFRGIAAAASRAVDYKITARNTMRTDTTNLNFGGVGKSTSDAKCVVAGQPCGKTPSGL